MQGILALASYAFVHRSGLAAIFHPALAVARLAEIAEVRIVKLATVTLAAFDAGAWLAEFSEGCTRRWNPIVGLHLPEPNCRAAHQISLLLR